MAEEEKSLPRFRAALLALGPNNRARAAVLGITDRQVWTWLNRTPPKILRTIPADALRALADDVEAEQTVEQEPRHAA